MTDRRDRRIRLHHVLLRPRQEQGAVFLLQSYLLVFWFVLLTSTMLVRSSTDLQAANVALESQQTFWLSETAIDSALYAIRLTPPTLTGTQCTTAIEATLEPTTVSPDDPTREAARLEPVATERLWALLVGEELAEARVSGGVVDDTTTLSGPSIWTAPYTYQICRIADGQYQITARATSGRATNTITVLAELPNERLRFPQAVTALKEVDVIDATLASVTSADELEAGGGLFKLPTTTGYEGAIANALDAQETTGDTPNVGVNLTHNAVVQGPILLSEGLNRSVGDYVKIETGSTYHANSEDAHAAAISAVYLLSEDEQPETPSDISVPAGAIELGQVNMTGKQLALAAGTYHAGHLKMTKSLLYTTGSGRVTIYVDGDVNVAKSLVYGQPDGFHSALGQLSPKNLFLVATTAQTSGWKFSDGFLVATVHAQNRAVDFDGDQLFVGAVVAEDVQLGGTTPKKVYAYYDASLKEDIFAAHTNTRETAMRWFTLRATGSGSGSDSTSTNPFVTTDTVEWTPGGEAGNTDPPPTDPPPPSTSWTGWNDTAPVWNWPPPPPPPACGDHTCNGSETTATCWQDCGTRCGDHACNGSESTVTCSTDCGTRCGDGVCNGSETCYNMGTGSGCNADCGTCPVGSSSGGGDGCFLPGTPVLLADGTTKPIEQVQVGESLMEYDEASGTFESGTVRRVFVDEDEREYLVFNRRIKVTPHHNFWINGEWKEARHVTTEDQFLTAEGQPEPITSIERVVTEVPFTVYHLNMNPYPTFIAGGVVVHNMSCADSPSAPGCGKGPM